MTVTDQEYDKLRMKQDLKNKWNVRQWMKFGYIAGCKSEGMK